ncbi:MAG: YdiU family protein [Steroidobacteraceae bacterium]|jgi:uncharacterized protein YdiU (UPF0061 family)|nr:YdiU family protein [Steroidobacteraceae bacterium]
MSPDASLLGPGTPPLADLLQHAFDSRVVRELPGDPDERNVVREVRGASWTRVVPSPVRAPRLLAWSDELGERLGIARPPVADAPAVQVLAGNALVPGMTPFAARYGGHQFGNWAGQLGDGRAITLGEVRARDGQPWELQLKGAGRTPYSRHADGRAVLRSSLREFLCSEAMHALGVPTTRALSLVATGEPVVRDMFYDGNPQAEPGAIVCRAAPSFLRFGNFEIHAAHGEDALLRTLAEHVIAHHYPELDRAAPQRHADWFAAVARRTARMVAEWMRVGFVHGVMNTDNMSILGLTIDYGPYGWLEDYDPGWTPNTTDAAGRRYCFGNQPQIALWNLARLAGALRGLVGDDAALQRGLEEYRETFRHEYLRLHAAKLGLASLGRDGDEALLGELFTLLAAAETDLTLFFRGLARLVAAPARDESALLGPLRAAFYDAGGPSEAHGRELLGWLRRYLARAAADDGDAATRRERMDRVNPLYVPRNWLAQQAIDAATEGDLSVLERLLAVLRRPYDERAGDEAFAARRPEWARHRPGCSALSCSS